MVNKFEYKLPFYWYFRYRYMVDNHNNLRNVLPSIGYIWVTHQWECQSFTSILAISEVDTFLILRYFVYCGLRWEVMPMLLEFFWKLVWQSINNIYIGERGGVSFFHTTLIR